MCLYQMGNMPEIKPKEANIKSSVIEAFIASSGIWLFAIFTHSGLPLVLLSATGLLATTLALLYSLHYKNWSAEVFGFVPMNSSTVIYFVISCAVGAIFGAVFRISLGMGPLPSGMGRFVFTAASIGAVEEVLFRGYVQGRLRCLSPIIAIIFAAAGHTIYKSLLFALPPENIVISFSYKSFAIWTFIVGAVSGSFRELSGSVLPPIVGHVTFDVIVYGNNINAPWWVWS